MLAFARISFGVTYEGLKLITIIISRAKIAVLELPMRV